MDKLPEPEFKKDKSWPRLSVDVDEQIANKGKYFYPYFGGLAAISIFRYWREITFYKKDHLIFSSLIVPTFIFSSWAIAKFLTTDPYL